MGDPLRKSSVSIHRPVRHRPGSSRKRCALSKPKQNSGAEHGWKAARQTSQESSQCPYDCGDGQRQPRAQAIADPATDNLKYQVRISEGRKDKSDLHTCEMKLLL